MELVQKLLLAAISGERGAEAGYGAYKKKALFEGYIGVASLFEALSRAEAVHAGNHVRALRKNGFQGVVPEADRNDIVLSTRENLERAVASEAEEFKEMYPSFSRQIRKKYGRSFEAKIALLSIRWAAEAEEGHHDLLREALEQVQKGNDISGGDYYLCRVCGTVHYFSEPPKDVCEVCGHDIAFYLRVRVEK